MLSSDYLYDVDVLPSELQIPKEVIDGRIKLLNEHLTKLLEIEYTQREFTRVNAIQRAIKFWEDINVK